MNSGEHRENERTIPVGVTGLPDHVGAATTD
jgi:hypothetical protein